MNFSAPKLARLVLTLTLLFSLAPTGQSQTHDAKTAPQTSTATATTTPPQQQPDANTGKAEEILRRAVEAHGGRVYLGLHTIIAKGQFTAYKDGISGVPSAFTDYLALPDRERTEFRGGGINIIQTNNGHTGWIFDGATRRIVEMTPAQTKDFQTSTRTSLDNILRGWWRKEGATLAYAGRREAGLAKRNETVRLTYADGFSVEFEFGARDGLLAKTLYKRQNAEGEEVAEEDRFAQHLSIEGVTVPFVIDHFRAGVQTSRINFQTIEFNRLLPESFFAKPASIKELK